MGRRGQQERAKGERGAYAQRPADMDLVCLIDNKEAALHASDLVAMIGDLLERGASPAWRQTGWARLTSRRLWPAPRRNQL